MLLKNVKIIYVHNLTKILNNYFTNNIENNFLIPLNNKQYTLEQYTKFEDVVNNILKISSNLIKYIKENKMSENFWSSFFRFKFNIVIQNFKDLHNYIFEDNPTNEYENDIEFLEAINNRLETIINKGLELKSKSIDCNSQPNFTIKN